MKLLSISAVFAVLISAAPAAAQGEPFAVWLSDFENRAVARGHDRSLVAATMAGVEPHMRLIELDRSQPEYVRPIWEYLESAVSESRVETGRERFGEETALLSDIENRWGVDAEALVAIWGLESAYGALIGDYDVVRSLATLAWDGRRRDLFEGQLFAVFDILRSGAAAREDLIGGWAGAMGQTQFMPTSYLENAIDYDGDGRKDVWANRGDALGSAAAYLADRGWRRDEPWGVEVMLPAGFDHSLSDGRSLSGGAWAARGVIRADRQPWSADAQFRFGKLLLPAGARGPAFVVYENFAVIMRYNNSTSYALAAGLLADHIAGRGGVWGTWPEDERPLSSIDASALQEALTMLGFDTGGTDGIIGPNTRRALRAWQTARGLPADAYATQNVLTLLTAEVGPN